MFTTRSAASKYDLNADDVYTGTNEYDWDFTQNLVNEITQWDNQTNQVVPVYDLAGNMTDDKRNWKYEYDAWYRLVEVKDQSDAVIAEFKYNGVGHRIAARYNQTAPWYNFVYDDIMRRVNLSGRRIRRAMCMSTILTVWAAKHRIGRQQS